MACGAGACCSDVLLAFGKCLSMVDRPISAEHSYRFGPFCLDVSHQQLYKDDQPVELARRCFRALQLLVQNHGRDLDKAYLIEQLWPDTVVEENNLTVIISILRKALRDDGEHKYILTNPGRGYRFVGDVIEREPDVLTSVAGNQTEAAAAAIPRSPDPSPASFASSGVDSRSSFIARRRIVVLAIS